jgi:hypothetical protein
MRAVDTPPTGRLRQVPTAPVAAAVLAALVLLATGCTGRDGLLTDVQVSRSSFTPDGSPTAFTELRYSLAGPARVDVVLSPQEEGEPVYLRRDESRPVAGSYVFRFDGSYPLPDDTAQRRLVKDGRYRLAVHARDAGGRVDQAEAEVEVLGVDPRAPEVQELSAQPTRITPDFDGVDDVAHLSFRLTKAAEVSAYVLDEAGGRRWTGPTAPRTPGAYAETWNALQRGRPLPPGRYQFVVRAEDEAGSVSLARVPITVESSGLPAARILEVSFSPRRLIVGDLLRIEMRVRNEGSVPLRTHGPDPGYVYSSYDNYFSIENRTLVDRAGFWRVGVDWAGAPGTFGGKYPYRWGFGKDLAPGEEVTVVGSIRIEHQDQRAFFGDRPDFHRMIFFGALVQEGVAVHQDRVGQTEISLSF